MNKIGVQLVFKLAWLVCIHVFVIIKRNMHAVQRSNLMHWFCLVANLGKQRLQNYNIMVNILNQSDEFK